MIEKEEIERYLSDLARSPVEVMDRVPPKRAPAGRPMTGPMTAFDAAAIASGDFVLQRDRVRARLPVEDGGGAATVADFVPGKAPIQAHDRAADLVDTLRYAKPAEMDAANLSRATLAETPWSGDYWPVYLGLLGRRYADPGFPAATDWKENHDYVVGSPAAKIIASRAEDAIDALSPSEKYDLLVGDAAGTLTTAMWAEGEGIYADSGSVETWMGICHGWAPASYMLARPRRTVTVETPGGGRLRFYPADIKALASLLWARSSPAVRFIGTRCDEKGPAKDENGRVLSDACFDESPGTWHVAVVNQIGVAKRAFVMDATYDYQVWNQPVCGYEYRYFNPQTMRLAEGAREGTVARADFTRDRFSRYRSERYAAALGVAMRTRYAAETRPTHAPTDDPDRDRIVLVDYFYDLELDAAGLVLGGEWYVNRHPDFLWGPAPGVHAVTAGDELATGAWAAGQPVPPSWRSAAGRDAADGLPLARIVDQLVAMASR
jgi:hypothetical protein